MSEPSERLREARIKAGYDSAKAAAEAMGATPSTYIQHENGTRGYPAKAAARYAAFFHCSPEWLLYGRSRSMADHVRIIGRVGADASGEVFFADSDARFDMVPLPPGGTSKTVALEVNGSSMPMLADDGSLIYFDDQKVEPTPDLIGELCAVETEDGRVLVKRLQWGSGPGLFNLESAAARPIKDVRLRWAAEITYYVPPRQARRIIKRADDFA